MGTIELRRTFPENGKGRNTLLRLGNPERPSVLPGTFTTATCVALFLCCSIHDLEVFAQESDTRFTAQRRDGPSEDAKEPAESDDVRHKKSEAQKAVDEVSKEILDSKEPNPYLYEERADAFMVLGNFDKAFEDYSKAITITAPRSSAYFLFQKRVWAAIEKGDYRKALTDTEGLTRFNVSPPQADPYAMLALILARSPDEKVRDAKGSLGAAIRAESIDVLGKRKVLVERALAAAYSVNGDFKAAVVHQEKAIAALKGKVPSDMKAELDAYKTGKEYPFQKRSKK